MADDQHSDKVFVTFLVLAFVFLVSLAYVLFPRHEPSAPTHAGLQEGAPGARTTT